MNIFFKSECNKIIVNHLSVYIVTLLYARDRSQMSILSNGHMCVNVTNTVVPLAEWSETEECCGCRATKFCEKASSDRTAFQYGIS